LFIASPGYKLTWQSSLSAYGRAEGEDNSSVSGDNMKDLGVLIVTIYTDGACEPNPGQGGWAALIIWQDGYELELSGSADNTTNNRMELTAIIEALKQLDDHHVIELYCDSQYCEKMISGYNASANKDLIADLDILKHRHKIHFHWVRSGTDPVNIMLDQMAKNAIGK
jgi:ribonuclease HI